MSQPVKVLYWAEGPTDRAAAVRIIGVCGGIPGPDYGRRTTAAPGKDRLDQKLAAYNAAARFEPFLILRDLDRDAECAAGLLADKLPTPEKHMCFRIVVPELEAWLMADVEAFCAWLQIDPGEIPADLEYTADAKSFLLNLAHKSKDRQLRSDLLPRPRAGRREGSLYSARLTEFISTIWDPNRAAVSGRAPSLGRALAHLKRILGAV